MSVVAATGSYTVVATGYVALGEVDQSEGRGGKREVGRFTTVDEAIATARGQGVQGDAGEVAAYEMRLYEGGAVTEHRTPLIARRFTPDGRWTVGWLDLREYADQVVPEADRGPCTCPFAEFFTAVVSARRWPSPADPDCPTHGQAATRR